MPDLASLDRGLRVLALVQDEGRLTVSRICAALDLPTSSAYRYVRALQAAGFLLEEDGSLLPGPRMAEVGDGGPHLVDVARPVLHRLSADSGLSVNLTVRVHSTALCLDTRRAPAMRTTTLAYSPGEIRPLYAGAGVTPLLAHAPADVVRGALGPEVRRFTAATPTAQRILAELPAIRRDGHHVTRGWISPGLTSVGVPVLVDGRCLCAVSVVGPDAHVRVDRALADLDRAVTALLARIPAELTSTWLPPVETAAQTTP